MAPEERPVISGWWDCCHRVGGGKFHGGYDKSRYGMKFITGMHSKLSATSKCKS